MAFSSFSKVGFSIVTSVPSRFAFAWSACSRFLNAAISAGVAPYSFMAYSSVSSRISSGHALRISTGCKATTVAPLMIPTSSPRTAAFSHLPRFFFASVMVRVFIQPF